MHRSDLLPRSAGLGLGHPLATPMGSPTAGAAGGAPGPSSAPVGQAVAQSGVGRARAVAGLRVGAVAARCLGGARGHPVATGVDGQRPLLTPSPARNPAPGKLFRPVSWTCTGRLFALKAGSCGRQPSLASLT